MNMGFVLPTAALREAARRPAELPAWRDVRAEQQAQPMQGSAHWPWIIGGLVLAVLASRYLNKGRPA